MNINVFQKMKLNFTIRRLLIGLVCMGVGVTFALACTSLYSNYKLTRSREKITGVVIPLESATHGVEKVVMEFTRRQYAIADSETTQALENSAGRRHLEDAFSSSISRLKQFLEESGELNTSEKVEKLNGFYQDMLVTDAQILDTVREKLKLEEKNTSLSLKLDKTGLTLQENSEKIPEMIREAYSEYLAVGESKEIPQEAAKLFMKEYTKKQKLANDLRLAVSVLTNLGRQMLIASERDQIGKINENSISKTLENAKKLIESLKMVSGDTMDLPDLLSVIENDFNELKSILASIAENRMELLSRQTQIAERKIILNQTAQSIRLRVKDLQDISDKVRTTAKQEADIVTSASRGFILIVSVIAIVLMIGMGWLIVRRIIGPIDKVVYFADTISRGDLTAEIIADHQDEIGTLVSKLSDMAHNLNMLIGQVQRSGIQVTSSATELSATSKQQEAVMKTQLESTNYVVRSVEEISNVSSELVNTVKRVAEMSDQTAEFASSGQDDLSQMEEAMHHMENASKSISAKLEAINEKAANITSVVTTITKVADQTNLLSLNAAIEAEKAGEYGRGFTVFAREIRRLADQTAVATLDIEQMVQEMQSAVSAGVMEMDAFIAEVQRSAENVGKISNQLTRIIQQVQTLSPSFEEVNEAMQMQSGNATRINASMASLSEEMQQTVESLQESFMAIEQLNDAARGLQDEVSRFRLM